MWYILLKKLYPKVFAYLPLIGGTPMTGFIEEFFYGNLDPQASAKPQSKFMRKCLQTLSDRETFLTDALTGTEKKQFLDYINAWSGLNGETALDCFTNGFRLGAMFTMNTFFPALVDFEKSK